MKATNDCEALRELTIAVLDMETAETLREVRALDLAEAVGADWAEVDGRRIELRYGFKLG